MTWPQWIEELKERYLADAGNVFLLVGPAQAKRWTVEGETLTLLDASGKPTATFER